MSQHASALSRLSLPLRRILQVKALMGGLSRSHLPAVLKAAELPPPSGNVWTPTALRAAEHTLQSLQLVDAAGHPPPELVHPLALEACAIPDIFAAFDAVLTATSSEALRVEPVRLRLRLAVYAGHEQAYMQARSLSLNMYGDHGRSLRVLEGQFLHETFSESWFRGLPALARADLFAEHAALWLRDSPPAGWNAELTALSPCPELVLQALPRTMLALDALNVLTLMGQGEAVETLCSRGVKDEHVALAASGVAAFFRNDPHTAHTLLREARKRLRSLQGRRTLQLSGVEGLCFTLALVLTRDPKFLTEADKLLTDTMDLPGSFIPALWAAHSLIQLHRGDTDGAESSLRFMDRLTLRDPLSRIFVYTAHACISPATARGHLDDMAALLHRLRPFPVAAALLASSVHRISPQTADNPPCPVPDFLDLADSGAVWERRLDSLDHLLGGESKGGTSTGQRLAWLLDTAAPGLQPLQQNVKGGGWTAGRAVSLKRLHEAGPDQGWITPQDRRIIACVEWKPNWSGGVRGEFNLNRALAELVGHPCILHHKQRTPLTLNRVDVALDVRQTPDGFELALDIPSGCKLAPDTPLVTCSGDVCTLHHVPPRLVPALEILRDPVRVPRSGTSRVMDFITQHAGSIPVRTDMAVETSQADPRPVLRLSPSGSGLRVELVVRPLAMEDTPHFPPGKGALTPMGRVGGRLLMVQRDFAAERQAVEALLQACPTLDEHCDHDGQTFEPFLIDETGTILQALLEVREADVPHPPLLEWPQGERFRVTPQIGPERLSLRARKAGDWFQVSGAIQLDEKRVLDMAGLLERLDETGGAFIPLGDGEFLALTRRLRRQLDKLRRLSEADKDGGRRIHPLGVGVVDDLLAETAAPVASDDAWLARVQTLRAADASVPVLPSTLKADLRDYQMEGFQWMARLARWGAGACLADDMGLGKTVQTLAVLLDQAAQGPCLVVAPMSVCHNWESEAARFAPTLRVHRFGAAAQRAALVQGLGPGDVLVVSYNLLQLEQAALASPLWRMVVFDEAQALKNPATKRARAARAVRAAFRVALTGTPIENELDDLWSIFNSINPGLLGTLPSFRKRFSAAGVQPGTGEDRNPARQALKTLVRPFILRRTKTAVLTELPPRTEQVLRVEMAADERAVYEALRRKALDQIEKSRDDQAGQRRLAILAELTRLRRACCHPALIDPQTPLSGSKLEAFLELARELRQGRHKALVFSQFVGHLSLVRKALEQAGSVPAGLPPILKDDDIPLGPLDDSLHDDALSGSLYQYLDGSTPEKERQRAVQAFQDGEGDFFLISLKAGGQGLNLTAADYVIHLDPWWNPAVEDQASDRAHRMGQERPVTIYRLVVQDSVEERILNLHHSKRALAADFLEGADTPLSEDDLINIIGCGGMTVGV